MYSCTIKKCADIRNYNVQYKLLSFTWNTRTQISRKTTFHWEYPVTKLRSREHRTWVQLYQDQRVTVTWEKLGRNYTSWPLVVLLLPRARQNCGELQGNYSFNCVVVSLHLTHITTDIVNCGYILLSRVWELIETLVYNNFEDWHRLTGVSEEVR